MAKKSIDMSGIHESITARWDLVRKYMEGGMDSDIDKYNIWSKELVAWVGKASPKIWETYIPPEMQNDPDFLGWFRAWCK